MERTKEQADKIVIQAVARYKANAEIYAKIVRGILEVYESHFAYDPELCRQLTVVNVLGIEINKALNPVGSTLTNEELKKILFEVSSDPKGPVM